MLILAAPDNYFVILERLKRLGLRIEAPPQIVLDFVGWAGEHSIMGRCVDRDGRPDLLVMRDADVSCAVTSFPSIVLIVFDVFLKVFLYVFLRDRGPVHLSDVLGIAVYLICKFFLRQPFFLILFL